MTVDRRPERAARAVMIGTAGNIIAPIAGLLSVPILANELGAVGRGEVAAATAPLILGFSALTLGLPEALTYSIARSRSDVKRVLAKALSAMLLAGVAGCLLVWLLADFLSAGNETLQRLIPIAALAIVPAMLLAGVRGVALAFRAWGAASAERIFTAVARLLSFIVLAQSSALTVESAVAVIAVTSFVGVIVYLPQLPRWKEDRWEAESGVQPRLFHFALNYWVGALLGTLVARLDQLLIVPLSDERQLGVYAVAVSLAEVVLLFNYAVRDVVFSLEASRQDLGRVAMATRLSTAGTAVSGAAVVLGSFAFVPVVFGDEFGKVPILVFIMVVGAVVGNPGSVMLMAMSAWGRPHLRSWAILASLVAATATLLLLVPRYGAIGAAVATAMSPVVSGAVAMIFVQRYYGGRPAMFLGLRRADIAYVAALIQAKLRARSA